ncbi:MAG: hypothetical protein Q7T04_04625 [Dehalococcoidia bacterium]|nr:hypothetical protein [Dehalococcoidia bacterium]
MWFKRLPKSQRKPQTPEPKPEGKNPAAVALGHLGGKKGGPARAKKLTPEQRKEIAKIAATARWKRMPPLKLARMGSGAVLSPFNVIVEVDLDLERFFVWVRSRCLKWSMSG